MPARPSPTGSDALAHPSAYGFSIVRSPLQPKLNHLFDDAADNLRGRIVAIYAILFAFNIAAWLWASIAFHHYPVLLGTALLAYSFGLRHAVDADHIAAIDNVTRKLMQDGKRPVAVGFMFSLGHSTIVVLGSAAIAGAALALQHRLDAFRNVAGVIGTLVSAFFLFAIALVNLIVLRSIYRTFVRVRRGEPYVEEDLDLLLGSRGLLSRVFRPMFRMITRSWHMYPLGVLFGLGFDTATEIGLLGVSATEASKGLFVLVGPRVPRALCGRNVAHRYHRQHPHVGRVRMGLRKAHSQALLQHHDHMHLRSRRAGRRRHRGSRTTGRTFSPERKILGRNRQS